MTTAEKAQLIVDMVRSYTKQARSDLSNARISLASVRASEDAWNQEEARNEDIGWGHHGNPHEVVRERKSKEVEQLSAQLERYQEAEDLAISHFLAMIPDEEEK